VLAAEFAILVHRQAFLEGLLVLFGKMSDPFAFRTLQFDHVVLRHKISTAPRYTKNNIFG
jgi:hypothetical protein